MPVFYDSKLSPNVGRLIMGNKYFTYGNFYKINCIYDICKRLTSTHRKSIFIHVVKSGVYSNILIEVTYNESRIYWSRKSRQYSWKVL